MLVSEAVGCREAGRYAAAMTLALSQFDGITREVVAKTFFHANPDATEPDYTDDKTLARVRSVPLAPETSEHFHQHPGHRRAGLCDALPDSGAWE